MGTAVCSRVVRTPGEHSESDDHQLDLRKSDEKGQLTFMNFRTLLALRAHPDAAEQLQGARSTSEG